MAKNPRIIYFIKGALASAKEEQDAARYGNNVVFRNASLVGEGESPEKCDGVAGAIPASYAELPKAKPILITVIDEPEQPPAPITPQPEQPPAAPVAASVEVPPAPPPAQVTPDGLTPIAPPVVGTDGWPTA